MRCRQRRRRHGPDHGSGSPGAASPRDPFAFQGKLANDITRRSASAGKLREAIAALRARLTPEQLEILASAERPHKPYPSGGAFDYIG